MWQGMENIEDIIRISSSSSNFSSSFPGTQAHERLGHSILQHSMGCILLCTWERCEVVGRWHFLAYSYFASQQVAIYNDDSSKWLPGLSIIMVCAMHFCFELLLTQHSGITGTKCVHNTMGQEVDVEGPGHCPQFASHFQVIHTYPICYGSMHINDFNSHRIIQFLDTYVWGIWSAHDEIPYSHCMYFRQCTLSRGPGLSPGSASHFLVFNS